MPTITERSERHGAAIANTGKGGACMDFDREYELENAGLDPEDYETLPFFSSVRFFLFLQRSLRSAGAAAAAAAKKPSSSGSGSTTYAVSGGSEMGQEVANYALQFVGNPYVYGGSSLTNGTDCSGFVMSVYANFGVSLPHSSTSDRSQGAAVDGLANAQPGDIVCYSGHVALYIGNNQIVHASTSKTGIIVSQADYKSVLAVRRIF